MKTGSKSSNFHYCLCNPLLNQQYWYNLVWRNNFLISFLFFKKKKGKPNLCFSAYFPIQINIVEKLRWEKT